MAESRLDIGRARCRTSYKRKGKPSTADIDLDARRSYHDDLGAVGHTFQPRPGLQLHASSPVVASPAHNRVYPLSELGPFVSSPVHSERRSVTDSSRGHGPTHVRGLDGRGVVTVVLGRPR